MKKLILFSILFVFSFIAVKAQTITMTASGDTVVNAGTKACSLKVANPYHQVSIHALMTKISGTVAGTLTLQGTVDGVTWVTVDSALYAGTATASTFTATNVASQSKIWIVNNSPYLWFKLTWTGTGTMSATLKGYVLPRKQG